MPVPTPFQEWSAEQIESALPKFTTEIHTQMARRIFEIALRYKDRIQSWDVVNESASDAGRGVMIDGSRLCKSEYGLMPGDYAYRAFKLAESVLSQKALLNINDYNLGESYLQQVLDLKRRGCRIDVIGAQMHLFNPQFSMDIAEGKPPQAVTVEYIRKTMNLLSQADIPIHLSEITIPTPGNDERSLLIQAIIARNLYRLWFSQKNMMGITWWNVVDGCGAPGEPSVSGMFTRDMQTKPVYHVLNDLLHREWKTSLNTRTDSDRTLRFRGFRGRYQLSWQDADGVAQSVAMQLD